MSTKKINSVLDFPKPTVNTQLRSFLGLANYFKDFVPNHSNVVLPLFKMIDHSATKQTSIKWTKGGESAFKAIQLLIADSPTLHFIHPTAPIVLMTDASDYGIGGCLYQVVDNMKQFVALVSKALTSTQLSWSVIQKEAYAIFFCCTHLDSMLRDRKFTILTDHKNLTFIKQASNPMIIRWHLALQELDSDVQFVAGVDNEIADAMSRLSLNYKPPKTNEYILASIDTPYVISNDNYLMIGYVHNGVMGHGSVERTLIKLETLKQVWPYMRLDFKTYIRDCASMHTSIPRLHIDQWNVLTLISSDPTSIKDTP
jgi:RNase H-like domain found in reverse transcriptase